MTKKRKYKVYFKNTKIDPIQFRITEDEVGNCRIPNGIKIKNETHNLNANVTFEQAINWVEKTLQKFEIEEIKENK